MTLPTLHLNGTAASNLLEQYRAAHMAVYEAIRAVQNAAPHGRDYYPQSNEAIYDAQTEHEERLTKLYAVADELMKLAGHVYQEIK